MTPRTITVSPLLGASLRLTAAGGPVSWSITESAGLLGRLTVSPSSGRLQAGQSVTVTVSASSAGTGLLARVAGGGGGGGGACVGCQLTVNPGDIKVTVILAVSTDSSSPPPSSPGPEVVAARPLARLEN